MVIVLFTDFGSNDVYVGQVESVLEQQAPGVRIIHLLHDAQPFEVRAAAHLLAALGAQLPPAAVVMAVVDPGVGGQRRVAVVKADERWLVGPDNGLLSVLAARASSYRVWHLPEIPANASASFHGRDVFAPLAASIATARFRERDLLPAGSMDIEWGPADLAEVVHVDHYGNAFTGLRAAGMRTDRGLEAGSARVPHARVFSDVLPGTPFWYENSVGLVEVAVNAGNASRVLGLRVGTPVRWSEP